MPESIISVSSSSMALEYLQNKADVPVFGVIEPGAKKGGELFFVSDDIEKFKELGGKFLGRPIENVGLADGVK